jgi:hypothetical protein
MINLKPSFMMDGTGSIGWFLSDSFSLQLMPGLFYTRNVSDNGDSVNNGLWLSMGAGFDYYFYSASPAVFSLGLDGAVTFMPGIDGKYLGADKPNDSMAVEFSLTPNIASYYFITDRVAPYVSICPSSSVSSKEGKEQYPTLSRYLADRYALPARFCWYAAALDLSR